MLYEVITRGYPEELPEEGEGPMTRTLLAPVGDSPLGYGKAVLFGL